MLFFSKGVYEFNKGFSHIFKLADNEDDMEGEGQREEEGIERTQKTAPPEDSSNVSDAEKHFAMLSLIKCYADFTNNTFDVVWDKSIVEFFNMLAFIKEYKRREAEDLKRASKKNSLTRN